MFSLIFLLIAILIVVRWYLILVLIFIFLRSDSGQLFMYLLVICIFLWEKNSKLHCLFIAMGYMSYLFFWTLTPYHIYTNTFFYSMGFLVILLMIPFAVMKLLIWYSPSCLFLLFDVTFSALLARSVSRSLPVISPWSFTVSDLKFKTLNPFWVDFCECVR